VGGGGQLLLTLNAVWDIAAQHWHKDSTGDAAVALIFDVLSGSATFCIQHGTGTWTTWIADDITLAAGVGIFQSMLVGGNIVAGGTGDFGGTLHAVGAVTFDNTLHVQNVATVDLGVISGADYILPAGSHIKYASLVAQFRRIPICNGIADETVNGAIVFDGEKWHSSASGYVLTIPLPQLSNQTELDSAWIRYEASGADGTLELVRVLINDWGVSPSGATPTVVVLATATLTTTGSGVKSAVATPTPESLDHIQYDYFLRITGSAGATHRIWGAQLFIKPFSPGID
jgi:hypothetical protein